MNYYNLFFLVFSFMSVTMQGASLQERQKNAERKIEPEKATQKLLLSNEKFPTSNITLSRLKAYAEKLNEFPQLTDPEWTDIDYTDYYTQMYAGLFNKIQFFLGFKTVWPTVSQFKTMLQETTRQRENRGLFGKVVALLRLEKPTKFYIWANLHGSYHSLVRSLTFLQSQNVISDDLEILTPDTYFVFNGNAIDNSPHSVETLMIILELKHKNPDFVFYLRGTHENQDEWRNYSLKKQLEIFGGELPQKAAEPSLFTLTSLFFDTLPLALYISFFDKQDHVIRISNFGRTAFEIDETKLGTLFSETFKQDITYYNTEDEEYSRVDPLVVGIVKAQQWKRQYSCGKSLCIGDQDLGSTAWNLLSAPTHFTKKFFNLYTDAFVVLEAKTPIETSTLTLFENDLKSRRGFEKVKKYNIQTTKPIENNDKLTKKDTYTAGSSMALIRGVPVMGQRVKTGMFMPINRANKTGGIQDHLLRVIVRNDDYVPYLARKNILDFLDEGINTILLPIGSPTLSAYLDIVKDEKALVLFPITGGQRFRSDKLPGLVHFRTTYADEVKELIDFIIREYDSKKFAFFYQDDSYGLEGLKGAQKVLKEKGVEEWLEIPYTRGTTDLGSQAEKIKKYQPDALGLFSTAQATEELIRRLGIPALTNVKLFGMSFLGEQSFRVFIKQLGLDVLFSAVVPNPEQSNLEIVREYRQVMDAHNQPYDTFSLEAFIAASIYLEMLRKIEPPFTKEKIVKELESLKNYKFKGLTLTFNPERRDLSQPVWLEVVDGSWAKKDKNNGTK